VSEFRFDGEYEGNRAIKGRIQALVSRKDYEEFEDLREYPPALAVGSVFYSSKEAFADAVKKKLGGCPVVIKKVPDWARCMLATEDKPGAEFVILVDEAILAGYSEESQNGQFHRVLSYLKLQGKVDKETGNWAPTTDNGRPVYKIETPEAMCAQTLRRFGAFDPASAAVANAIAEAVKGQKMIDWEAKVREE